MPTQSPAGMTIGQFNRVKHDLAQALNGQCETCGVIGQRLGIGYHAPMSEPFDPDALLCRCRPCRSRGRTEPVKVVLAHVDA